VPRSFPCPVHSQVLTAESLHEPLCTARYCDVAASRMLRRAPNFAVGNWGSTNAGFTMRTGLAELIYLHPFGPSRFSDMLLSPSGFPSRLAGCPRRCLRSRPPAPGGQSHVRRNGAPQNLVWHRNQHTTIPVALSAISRTRHERSYPPGVH
jgi:hypothetical protein